MKLIYLSPNMSAYDTAYYQQETIEEIARQHKVYFYGPGFPDYSDRYRIRDVIERSGLVSPDAIVLGHAWLYDSDDEDVDRFKSIDLAECGLPKIAMLNKEYVGLEAKLQYFENAGIELIFSHDQNVEHYTAGTGIRSVFWPLGVDPRKFNDWGLSKQYDLSFTGTLRKYLHPETQTDIRQRIQRKLFYSVGDLKILKKPRYRKYSIYWQGYTHSAWVRRINHRLRRNRRMPDSEYSKLANRSKIYVNALAPLGVLSPRYYETMASKSLVFAEESDRYHGILEPGEHCVTFKEDLSDFDEKLDYYLANDDERQRIVDSAYDHVMANYTWEERVRSLTAGIASLIGKSA